MAAQQDKPLKDLFHRTLKDIYYAEQQIVKELPQMAKAASSDKLRRAFETHRDQTERQIERLDNVFRIIGQKPQGERCDAIEGILAEGREVVKTYQGSPALDPGLIASAQAVEHYEIARYGTLASWAKELGMNDALDLVLETLNEEELTDDLLSEIATTEVNGKAAA